MGCALMAVNIKKYSAINNKNNPFSHDYIRKSSYVYLFRINTTAFSYLRLVLSQPLYFTIVLIHLICFEPSRVYLSSLFPFVFLVQLFWLVLYRQILYLLVFSEQVLLHRSIFLVLFLNAQFLFLNQ